MVNVNGELVVLGGVPEMTPLDDPIDAHEGKLPEIILNVIVPEPVAVTVKVPAALKLKVALAALVIAGGCWTVSVRAVEVWFEPKPLLTMHWNWSPLIARVAGLIVTV